MKNYADIYNSSNDSVSLDQRFYAVLEGTKGTLTAPTDTDFFYTLGGGSISYTQPLESSPHRSGRHHTGDIKKKKETSFSFSTYFNIDETLGAASTAEIDPAVRMLWKSLLGKEDITGGSPVFTSATAPDLTFSLHEVGDRQARQARAAFVNQGTVNLPGNGEATIDWSGRAADSVLVGIGKTTISNDGGNTITLQTGEGDLFPVGAMIMLIEADGTTRSADTAGGTGRLITSKSGDIITVSGAALADADGSASEIYVVYAEPEAPTAIDNPVTGLVGSMAFAGLTNDCFRSATLDINNDHEIVDYCFGTDGLASPFFVPGSRLTVAPSIEMNLNDEVIRLFNRVQSFEAQDIDIVLGDSAGRHFKVDMPKVTFPVPDFAYPDTGSIPVTFSDGIVKQTALDAADEITASFL